MQHSERPDAELLERARAGSAPAFAVLLHRHGPAVRAVVADDPDATGAVIATFVRAMRQLPGSADGDPRRQLIELARTEVDHPRAPEPTVALDPDELDGIWAELDLRWPNGRVPRHLPRWVGWSASILALAALAVTVPYAVLALGAGGDDGPDELESLVARPFTEQADEPPAIEELEENREPPPFEFPDLRSEPEPDTDG